MPATSPAQERLMQAAAHTPGGYGGVPQSVGKEFVGDDAGLETQPAPAASLGRAAGIMFLTNDGETLLMRRGNGGDFPGTFGLPGGHQEDPETLEACARREALEETGFDYSGPLELLHDEGQFATFIARGVNKFDVQICDESTGFVWTEPNQAPEPIHPGLVNTLRIANVKTEFDVARLMQEGVLPSPQMYANMCLLAVRITGTGLAYRAGIQEHVWRDPSIYLNPEFLERCQGLIVVMDHPEANVLDSEEFKNRAIGSVILPYILDQEVWGIAKLYDQNAVNEILEGDISTSPSVVFDSASKNTTLTTEDGKPLLIEGTPFLLDHLAIVTKSAGSKGVWDKGGDPAGVLLNNQEVIEMSEQATTEAKADAAHGDKLDTLITMVSGIVSRVDALEAAKPAEPVETAADKKAKADAAEAEEKEEKAKADAAEAEEKAKADKARKDAEGSDDGERKEPTGAERPDADEVAAKADAEAAQYADCQAKADSVFAAFGKSASRPLQGEALLSYRKRLLRGLQAHSDAYKGISLASISDPKLLDLAEKQIFADALAASRGSNVVGSGQLIEINERDRSGRTITKFRGDMSAWLDDFKVPAMRATAFHTSNNQR